MKIIIFTLSITLFFLNTQLFAANKSFYGFSCTQDCSGHEAGYSWAETNDIHYEQDCVGKSTSFIEGCLAYIEDNEDISEYYQFNDDDEYLGDEDY
jgi:hypothetical protein